MLKKNQKLLLVTLTFLGFGAKLSAQPDLKGRISVDYQQRPLHEILDKLQEATSVIFSFESVMVSRDEKVTFKRTSMPVAEILQDLFAPIGLVAVVNGDRIIVKDRSSAGVAAPGSAHQTVRGVVTDMNSRIPLPGVTVALISGNPILYTSTNPNGEFRFPKVPVGRHSLVFTCMGYQKADVSGILIGSGKEMVLNVSLQEASTMLNGVVITDKSNNRKALNQMATVSARSFSVEETSRYPVSLFDPARMALNFAGVSSDSDLDNDIVVRGNSPKGILWRLEGAEIINPNHFGAEGSSGGGISMISSNMLANSDFLTGAFPAEYGNALSGVFDLQLRKGNTEKQESAVTIGILGTEVSTEGPFKKGGKASYLANYRYSTLDLLNKIGLNPVAEGGVPVYQDMAFNLNFPSKAGVISLFGIGGLGSQLEEAERDFTRWTGISDKVDGIFKYTSGSSGLKHFKIISDRLYTRNILSASYSRITDDTDTLDNNYVPSIVGRNRFINSSYSYTGLLNYKVNSTNTVRTGVIASILSFNLNSDHYDFSRGKLSRYLEATGNTGKFQAYIQWKKQLTEKWHVNTGMHSTYFALSDSWTAEPRVGSTYQASERSVWSFGAGLHSRVEPLAFYYVTKEPAGGGQSISDRHLELTKALHAVLGYEYQFNEDLGLKLEGYYQHLYDVPVVNDPNSNFSAINFENIYSIYSNRYGNMTNAGKGRNYGLEMTLERSLQRGFYYLLTTSLYDSRFKAASGREFNTIYNGNFVSNLVAGKEYKVGYAGKNVFAFNMKMVWNGGRKYTPIDLALSIDRGEQVEIEDQVNMLSTPQYFRTDVSTSFKLNKSQATHSFYIDVQNVAGRQNVYGVYFDKDRKEVRQRFHTGFVPTFNYKLEF